jgi:ABC-type transport system substrate-binding protein
MPGVDKQISRFALENLIGLNANGDPVPQLATSWETNPTAKTITFTLRQGVKFHDGTDFNAEAAKWCLDQYRNGSNADLKIVTSVDIIDASHIRLTMSEWNPLLLQSMSSSAAGKMVSPTAAQKLGDDIMRNPVGTGPFKFASFQPNVSIKFTRNENYWQKGLPYLDAVECNFVTDPVVSLAAFTKGEAQVLCDISTADAKSLKAKGITIEQATSQVEGIAGDSKNPNSPFADIRVRQAMAYALDTNAITNAVYDGLYSSTNQLAMKGGTGFDESIKGYPYNPDKAKELLAAAGYSSAKPLETKIVYTSLQQTTDLYTMVQSYFSKVGINLKLEPVDNAGYNKIYSAGWNNHLMDYRFSTTVSS